MNKKLALLLTAFITVVVIATKAQENSVSVNYLNFGKGKGGDWDSGFGLQGKIQMKNNWYLIPDIGFSFTPREHNRYHLHYPTHGIYDVYKQRHHFFGNINVAHFFQLRKRFWIAPLVGLGFYYRCEEMTLDGFVNDPINDNAGYYLLATNIGCLVEFNISKHIFLTAGGKYMIDIYDGTDYIPYLNAGIGYKF